MTDPDDPRAPRHGRLAKEKRVPISLRVTPRMRERLTQAANINGRSMTQQIEIMLDHALFRDLDELPLPSPIASTNDLFNQLGLLEARFAPLRAEFAGLRAAVEKGLDRNAEVIARVEARLFRQIAELEAKSAADTTELTTAIGHLQTVAAQLYGALQAVEAVLSRRVGEETDRRRPRPRVVPKAG
jgi:hypothetical protein